MNNITNNIDKRFPANTTLDELTFLNNKKVDGELYALLQSYSYPDDEKRTIVNLGKLRDNVKIELDITPLDDAGDFGIYLNEKECFDYYYMVRLDPLYQRMIFDKWPRFDRTKYGHVDSERPLEI